MSSVLLLKINGWPETFDERAEAIAANVDELVVVRPKPLTKTDALEEVDNIRTYDLYPPRGSFVKPSWLKPLVFPLHVLQAIVLMIYLLYRGKLPPVIHALDYALGGLAGAIVSRLFSIPFVVSVRGLKEPRYRAMAQEEQTLRSSTNYQILRSMTRVVLANADHVVTKAEYQVDFVKETFGVDPGFTTLPTGVDFDSFDPSNTENCGQFPEPVDRFNQHLDDDDKVILYLAKLVPTKGADKIIKHLVKLNEDLPSNIKFVFIGGSPSDSFKQHFKKLKQEVKNQTLFYPNHVPFDVVPELLSRADAVILLSEPKSEGVPRVLQESCAMQTPIVASDVTGITGAFTDLPGCYLIDRNNTQEFKSAVRQAVEDCPEMPREIFAEYFDMYKNYSKYAEVYAELAADN